MKEIGKGIWTTNAQEIERLCGCDAEVRLYPDESIGYEIWVGKKVFVIENHKAIEI